MKQKAGKKLLSLLLIAAMTLGLMPTGASAEELEAHEGSITIESPDRKIAYGISDFDLKAGMKATDANENDVLDLVDITNDGGCNRYRLHYRY